MAAFSEEMGYTEKSPRRQQHGEPTQDCLWGHLQDTAMPLTLTGGCWTLLRGQETEWGQRLGAGQRGVLCGQVKRYRYHRDPRLGRLAGVNPADQAARKPKHFRVQELQDSE